MKFQLALPERFSDAGFGPTRATVEILRAGPSPRDPCELHFGANLLTQDDLPPLHKKWCRALGGPFQSAIAALSSPFFDKVFRSRCGESLRLNLDAGLRDSVEGPRS